MMAGLSHNLVRKSKMEENLNREKNMKTLKIVGAVVVGVIFITAIGGSNSSTKQTKDTTPDTSYVAPTTAVDNTADWVTWKNGYLPAWNSFYAHYQQTVVDLGNGDIQAASNDYLAMSYDAVDMMQWDNSPSFSINSDVDALAADINTMCSEGNQSLININNGGDVTYGFQGAVNAVKTDINTMTIDLQNVNNGSY